MFFGGQNPFGFVDMRNMHMNGHNRAAGSTQYVFRNGNVEYKVFSSGFSGSRSNVYSFDDDTEDSEDDDMDVLRQILGNRNFKPKYRQQMNGQNNRNTGQNNTRGNSTSTFNNNTFNSSGQYKPGQNQRYTQGVRRINNNICYKLIEAIPILFLAFFVFSPYIISRF